MEPSKKYLIHCIGWNVLGLAIFMSQVFSVISDILGDFSIFILWSVTVIFFPLMLLIVGTYLLWRAPPKRKLVITGMAISALCLLFVASVIDGLFQPNLSSYIFGTGEFSSPVSGICIEDTNIPPNYKCPPKQ
jgi:hypothetical protein